MMDSDDKQLRHGRVPTRLALVEKAEELFGKSGIEGVSLRQIGAAIGSSNTNVVGYHFGDKSALIIAILEHRIPALEQRRAELLEGLEKQEAGLAALLRALWLPLFEQVNEAGLHSYAHFLGELIRSGKGEIRQAAGLGYPSTNKIMQRIRQLLPPEAKTLAEGRWRLSGMIIVDALRIIDQGDESDLGKRCFFCNALRMAEAVLTAPPAQS